MDWKSLFQFWLCLTRIFYFSSRILCLSFFMKLIYISTCYACLLIFLILMCIFSLKLNGTHGTIRARKQQWLKVLVNDFTIISDDQGWQDELRQSKYERRKKCNSSPECTDSSPLLRPGLNYPDVDEITMTIVMTVWVKSNPRNDCLFFRPKFLLFLWAFHIKINVLIAIHIFI